MMECLVALYTEDGLYGSFSHAHLPVDFLHMNRKYVVFVVNCLHNLSGKDGTNRNTGINLQIQQHNTSRCLSKDYQ
jgi:hypothetical protein